MKTKRLLSLLIVFAVVLSVSVSAGTVSAATPNDGPGSSTSSGAFSGAEVLGLPRSFTLEDSFGYTWDLDIVFGCVLYGTKTSSIGTYPAYGYVFGNEMVLWADNPGSPYSDSFAYTGMWNYKTMKFDGKWVGYPKGSGNVSMWFAKSAVGEGEEKTWTSENVEEGPDAAASAGTETAVAQQAVAQQAVAQQNLDAAPSTEGSASATFLIDGENAEEEISGLFSRGAICLEDSFSYTWDLDILYGCILYGTKTSGIGTHPAYGFVFGDEMFLWANNPGGKYSDSFVYTGKWNAAVTLFKGTWINYPMGSSGTVEVWPCGGGPTETEYYAVIAGEGYGCSYADSDAYDMYGLLTSEFNNNWKKENVRLLVSTADGTKHNCTRTKIRNGISWMASEADKNDVSLFFYAGHGGYQTDVTPLDESDGNDEYICPEGGNILDDELNDWLSAVPGYKLVALDSCFSGGFIKADGAEVRSVPGLPRIDRTDGFREDLCKKGFNVHTACDEDESAYGYAALNNGVFTYYLVQGLYGPADSDSDGDIDSFEAHTYTRPKVISYTGGDQNPWRCAGTTVPLIWVL